MARHLLVTALTQFQHAMNYGFWRFWTVILCTVPCNQYGPGILKRVGGLIRMQDLQTSPPD